jgi:menaquinone reductase, molybdopterin-binding-like subunit
MEKFERRDIIMMAGGAVAGSAVGTLFSGAPFDMLQWLVEWTQDQYVPGSGAEKHLETVCQGCAGACLLNVRMIGNRAVKVDVKEGGCPAAQLAPQILYHPERIQQPLKLVGNKGSNRYTPVSWEQAIKEITAKIESARSAGKGGQIAAVNGAAGTAGVLLERLVKSCGSPLSFREGCLKSRSAAAVNLTQNQAGWLHYDLENSDYILSFGARLVEGWGDPAAMNNAFLAWKKNGARYVHIDTICTRSASVADKWVPLKAGTEAVLALGIANVLITKLRRAAGGANFAEWSKIVINDYAPDRVAQITGVSVKKIEEIASEFSSAKSPVAVAGRGAKGVSSSTVEIVAVQALNALVNSFGRRGGVFVAAPQGLGEPVLDKAAADSLKNSKSFKGLDDFIKSDVVPEVVFINNANPVYGSVLGTRLAEKLEKTKLVVSIAAFVDDTAIYSDYILPAITGLEADSAKGEAPVAPRNKATHSADIVLMIAKGLAGIAASFPWKNYKELLPVSGRVDIRAVANFSFPVDLFKSYLGAFSKKLQQKEFPLALIPTEAPMVGDGNGLALPYVLKGLDGYTLTGKKLWVAMNPETADREGVSEGESIDIESTRGEIGSVKVHLTKTVAPDVIAIPIGFGHETLTSYAEKKGVNPKEIMTDDIDPVSGVADWWFTRVKIS